MTIQPPARSGLTGFLLAAALLAGCSGDDPVTPIPTDPAPPIVWNQLRGGVGVGEIRAVWGTSPGALYAVHGGGIARLKDGGWSAETTPGTPSLRAVWGAAAGTVFAGGDGGVILRRNGAGWSEMASPTGLDIRDLHGVSASDVYAVAATPGAPDAAELLHYDGTLWTHVDTRDGADGNAVCAVAGLAFVVGDGGTAFRHDGVARHDDDTQVSEDLLDVWAAAADDAHAVGEGGRILHWNGTAWTPATSGVTTRLRAVAGNAPHDVIAAGDGGVLLHYDGSAWQPVASGSAASLRTACVFADGRGAAAGEFGSLVVGAGTLWAPRHTGQPFAFESVWSTADYYMAVATHSGGGVIRDRDGSSWAIPEGMHAVSGFTSIHLVAGGDGGVIYEYNGLDWVQQVSPASSALRAMTSLVSRFGNPFRVYAVGDNGTIAIWKAGTWVSAMPPTGAEGHRFVDVWAAAIDDVFAVADNATSLVRYDDPYELGPWTIEGTPATAPLLAVGGWRGDVYIASAAGEIFFNDGKGWEPMPSPVTTAIRDIRTLNETSIFAVGDAGVILHYDGAAWRTTHSGFVGDLLAVWGGQNEPVFAVGSDGAVLVHED